MRRLVLALLIVPALPALVHAGPAGQAPAQAAGIDAFIGRPVSGITFVDENRHPKVSAALIALLALHPGEPLRPEALRTTVGRLYTAERLDDVEVTMADGPGGVDVTFRLVPRHPIDRLEVTGDTGLPADQLRSLIRERLGGRVPPEVRLQRVQDIVKLILGDEGWLSPHIVPSTVPTHDPEPERATLVVDVQAGVRARIGKVDVTGTSPLSHDDFVNRTDTQAGNPYRPRVLQAKLASIRDEMRSNEYYEAQASCRPIFSGDGTTVDLVCAVEPGPHVVVRWSGDPKPSGNEDDYVPIRRDNSVDEDLLDDSNRRLEAALRRDGYSKAQVTHARSLSGSELTITFTVLRGLRYRVDRIDIAGNRGVTTPALMAQLTFAQGDVFWQDRVEADKVRIFADYLRRGYFEVDMQSAYEDITAAGAAEGHMVVHLAIAEGAQANIADIEMNGPAPERMAELRGLLRSKPGGPYAVTTVDADREAIDTYYRNRGFQTAGVLITPRLSTDRHAVTLQIDVSEGPQILVADIQIIGRSKVSAKTIMDEIRLTPGGPLGESDVLESQRRLSATGLFRSVSVVPEPLTPGETHAHVLVLVDESAATTLGFGGGVEVGNRTRTAADGGSEDYLDIAPRGFFSIGRRNLWGQRKSIDLFSRLTLRPRSGTGDPLSDYRLSATYRSERAFHTDAEFTLAAFSERASRTSFNFIRHQLSAELLRRLTTRLSVSGRYALDFTRLLNVRIPIDDLTLERAFPNTRLSTVSTGMAWDRRNSVIGPAAGSLLAGDADLALRTIGSEVGFAKVFVQASTYRAVTASKKLVVAVRGELGLAHGFPREVAVTAPDGTTTVQTIQVLPASQRFFAGGGTTVRGFDQDRLGVPALINSDGLSNGGNGLVVLNLELRAIVGKLASRDFGVVGFIDGGNVFAKASDIALSDLRGAVGFGLRYDSPFGPLRVDIGFKLSRRPIGNGLERGWAYHLNLGEAF